MRSIIKQILPFIAFGMMIVLFAVGLILLSQLLIFGALIGLVLFAFSWIKRKLFFKKKSSLSETNKKSNRIIDHDDS